MLGKLVRESYREKQRGHSLATTETAPFVGVTHFLLPPWSFRNEKLKFRRSDPRSPLTHTNDWLATHASPLLCQRPLEGGDAVGGHASERGNDRASECCLPALTGMNSLALRVFAAAILDDPDTSDSRRLAIGPQQWRDAIKCRRTARAALHPSIQSRPSPDGAAHACAGDSLPWIERRIRCELDKRQQLDGGSPGFVELRGGRSRRRRTRLFRRPDQGGVKDGMASPDEDQVTFVGMKRATPPSSRIALWHSSKHDVKMLWKKSLRWARAPSLKNASETV